MKILYLDIETSPMIAYAWRTFKENIGVDQIIEPPRVICMAWAEDDGPVKFAAEWGYTNRDDFIEDLWHLLDHADVVIHFNGEAFDVPHLNREFIEMGMTPPAPFAQVDVYKAVRKTFKFVSNRLAWVSQVLTDKPKIHTDFTLWSRVLDGDKAAQKEMREYNMQDVATTRDIYLRLKPWIPSHPNVGLYDGGDEVCVACGSDDLNREGFAYTSAGKYQRFSCNNCGKWMRAATRVETTKLRAVR